MKSLISFNTEFYEKRKFQQNEEDSFALAFAKALFVFLVLFLAWNGYSYYKQIDLMANGTAVPARVVVSGKDTYASFVVDGVVYEERLLGIFAPDQGEMITAYYLDDPNEAVAMMAPSFYYVMYAISIAGIGLVFWWMKRLKSNIAKEKSID